MQLVLIKKCIHYVQGEKKNLLHTEERNNTTHHRGKKNGVGLRRCFFFFYHFTLVGKKIGINI